MKEVEFEESQVAMSRSYQSRGMIGFLLKKGWAKNPLQATVVLITFAVVAFVLSSFLFRATFQAHSVPHGFEGNAPSLPGAEENDVE